MSAQSLKWPRQMLPRSHITRAYVSGTSQMDGLEKVADAAIAMACERGDVIPAETVRELCAKEYAAGYAAIAQPVAAGSVDTAGMQRYSLDAGDMLENVDGNYVLHADAIAWGAQQRAAIKHEAKVAWDLANEYQQSAEKAGARLAELESEVENLQFEIAHPGDEA